MHHERPLRQPARLAGRGRVLQLLLLLLLAACLPAAAASQEAAAAPPPQRLHRPPLGPWRPPAHQRLVAQHAARHQPISSSPSAAAAAAGAGAGHHQQPAAALIDRCTLHWRNATLDHFSFVRPAGHRSDGTFLQRVFLCSQETWHTAPNGARGPIWLYLGNEADVTLYLNHTGLMWENAARFGALLVFAEHRYYGASRPWPTVKGLKKHIGYLTAEQALADYAELISELRSSIPGAAHSPVIGFGGSYGGMLATWMRMKYPHLLAGAVAASAPIWDFVGQIDPPADQLSFSKGVTFDASQEGGSDPRCVDAARRGWKLMERLGASKAGRAAISQAMLLCSDVSLSSLSAVLALRDWLASAWDYLAMGDMPYPSSYMTNGAGDLPAFPVRVACSNLTAQQQQQPSGPDGSDEDLWLLTGLAKAAGVLYNFTGSLECLSPGTGPSPESDEDANFWDAQWCAELLMPSARDGVNDMFYPQPFDLAAAQTACIATWGLDGSRRRPNHAVIEWGGTDLRGVTNIVFSNGLRDPWHGGGVLTNLSDSLIAIVIPEGAHHNDLMFSHPLDPPSFTTARQQELAAVQRWIEEASQPWPEQRARLAWWRQQQQQQQRRRRPEQQPETASFVGASGHLLARAFGPSGALVGGLLQRWRAGHGGVLEALMSASRR